MKILLSPAKSLDFEKQLIAKECSQPQFLKDAQPLVNTMRRKSLKALKEIMHISDKLVSLNKQRFMDFETPFTSENAKPAIGVFAGDVYQGLDVASWSADDLEFSQDQLRILSGLYGILRPLDLMQAYRLEMGTSLSFRKKKNLYQYWGTKLTDSLNQELKKDDFVVNLASNEYAKAIQFKNIEAPVYTANFKEYKDTKLTFVSFNAKRARGLMTKWLIQNRISDPKQMFKFNLDRYKLDAALSSDTELIFTRTFIKAGS